MKKKIIVIILMFGLSACVFAETYESLFNKAKEYEAKKEYVYALGYYYDAMESVSTRSEAADKYYELWDKLKSGANGLELSMWDDPDEAWNKVLMNFAKYFSEFPPYDFIYSGILTQGEINYKNKTVTYTMNCDSSLSEKFKKISSILANNIKYDSYEPRNWYIAYYGIIDSTDYHSINYLLHMKQEERYKISWIPYITFPISLVDAEKLNKEFRNINNEYRNALREAGINEYSSSLEDFVTALAIEKKYDEQNEKTERKYCIQINNEIVKFYKQTGIALISSLHKALDGKSNAFIASFISFKDYLDFSYFDKGNLSYLPYELEFAVYDSDDNIIAKGNRQPVSSSIDDSESKYVFSDITELQMDAIKKGNYTIKPENVYLLYGAFSSSGYKDDASDYEKRQSYIKNAAEIKMDINKINIVNQKEELRKQEEERQRKWEERQRQIEAMNYEENYHLLEKEIESFITNFAALGFSFDDDYCITEVVPKSPAQKAGIKVGNTINFSLTERDGITAQEIVDTLDLTFVFKDKKLLNTDMQEYIKQCLKNEFWIVERKIIPLLPGDSITCVINNGKKNKTITLTVPQDKKK